MSATPKVFSIKKQPLKALVSKHPYLFMLVIFPLIPFSLMALQIGIYQWFGGSEAGFESFQDSTKILSLLLYLLILRWLSWFRPVGLLSPGSWQAWLIMVVGALYNLVMVIALINAHFELRDLTRMADPPAYLLVGLFEEIAFRGLILFAFLEYWGSSRMGSFKAVLVSALIFGAGHLMTLFSGNSVSGALFQFGSCVFTGVYLGGLFLYGGSLWPAVVSHFLVDAIGIGNLAHVIDFTRANEIVFWVEVPLFFLGIYLLSKGSGSVGTHINAEKRR